MKLYAIKRAQTIDRPIANVFSFFKRPENLAIITPPAMDFTILTPGPLEMRVGALIDYTLRIMGLRTLWRTLIAEYDPPYRFVDIQLKGPYVHWHHTHTFTEQNGRTVMDDEVRYVLPFGPLGRAVHALLVERQLHNIFAFRAEAINRQFAPGSEMPRRKDELS